MVTDDVHITRIQNAQTTAVLNQSLERFFHQVFVTYPALRINRAFIAAIKTGRYYRALCAVRQAARGRGDRYQDVIRVLECVADKQVAFAEVHAHRETASPQCQD